MKVWMGRPDPRVNSPRRALARPIAPTHSSRPSLARDVDGRGARYGDVVTAGQGELLGGRAGVLHTVADARELTRQLVLAGGQLGPGTFQGAAKYGRTFGNEIEDAGRKGAASADAAREDASLDGEGAHSSGPK